MKRFKFEFRITTDEDDLIVGKEIEFDYDSVKTYGDCEPIDLEVGKAMRFLINKVERAREIEEMEEEVVKDLAELEKEAHV